MLLIIFLSEVYGLVKEIFLSGVFGSGILAGYIKNIFIDPISRFLSSKGRDVMAIGYEGL